MLDLLRSLFKPNLQSLNHVLIDKRAIVHNFTHLQALHPYDQIIPVLKSNAYGHGLKEICQILNDLPCELVAVDSFPEYQIVKKMTTKKILLIGETAPKNYRHFDRKRTSFAIYNRDSLEALIQQRRTCTIHLFLNTGMNREGIQMHELDEFLTLLQSAPQIEVEGIMSHFACADSSDNTGVDLQIENFKRMHEKVLEYGFESKYRHISASAGLLKIDDTYFNAHRTGIALYGYNPLQENDAAYTNGLVLIPALSLTSSVVSLQDIELGEGVGYEFTYTAPTDTRIATVPFGYYEGLPRSLSNNWQVKRKDIYFPIAGNISMNLCSFDAGSSDIALGDTVELISTGKSVNNLQYAADNAGLITYELLVNISPTVKRKII